MHIVPSDTPVCRDFSYIEGSIEIRIVVVVFVGEAVIERLFSVSLWRIRNERTKIFVRVKTALSTNS